MLPRVSPVVLPAPFKHKLCIDEAPAGYINRQIESSMQSLLVTCWLVQQIIFWHRSVARSPDILCYLGLCSALPL